MNSRSLEFYSTRAPLALALAALLSPLRAAAADDMDEIQITARRRAESALQVPVPTTLLGPETLRLLAPQTVMDALHGEPGSFVQQTTPGQSVVIMRGLKGSEVLHLVDGFRLNNAIFRNAPNQYVALVDGQNLDRIEVVRGPMSSLYGSDAMGGVVQMLSHEPRFSGSDLQSEGRLRSIYGSADRSLLSRAEGALGNESFSLSGGVTYQDTEELRRGGGDRIPFSDFRAHGGDVKLLGRLADGHELMFSAQQMTQPQTSRVDQLIAGFGQGRPESVTAQFRPQQRSFYHGRYRFEGATAAFDQLELHWGRQRFEDGNLNRERNDAGGFVRETRESTTDVTTGWTVQAGKALAEGHFFTYGGEYYHDRVHSARKRRDTPLAPLGTPGLFEGQAPRFPDGAELEQMALFAAHDWTVSPRFDVNYGLRYSVVRADIPGGFELLRSADLSGNLGMSYALRDTLRLVFNVGRGFRAPNIFDLGTLGNRPDNRFNVPNPELEPETLWSFDIGVKHAGERLQLSAHAFHSRFKDKITSVLTGRPRADDRVEVQSANQSRVLFWGLEAGARYQWTDSLALFGTATYTRGDEHSGGDRQPADRVPPLFGKLGVQWTWRDRLTLETYMFYANNQHRLSDRDRGDARINPDGTPGWSTLNVRATWNVNERATFSLRLENLLDRRYREHASGLDEPGLNALLTLDYRL